MKLRTAIVIWSLVLLLTDCSYGITVTVGPVIGRVTATTARILLEIDSTARITIKLTTATNATTSDSITLQANRPGAFSFIELLPRTRYTVAVEGLDHVASSFSTTPTFATLNNGLQFAFVACNRIWYTKNEVTEQDVWEELADRATDFQFTFHLGDQIYSDDWGPPTNEYKEAWKLLNETDKSKWETDVLPIIQKSYADIYRETWNHPGTKRALANIPNIMIADDHEALDDAGDKDHHHHLDDPDHFIIQMSRVLFLAYQRQLWEDVPQLWDTFPPPATPQENHMQFVMGEYGFILADNRYAKLFKKAAGDKTPFLTAPQWKEIDNMLSEDGPGSSVRLMLVMAQIPIVMFDQDLTEKLVDAVDMADDLVGMWEFGTNQDEQTRLLDSLYQWKQRGNGRREITLAGGDVHLAGYTLVERDNEPVMQQLIVGPVSGSSLNSAAELVLDVATSALNELGDNWDFTRYRWRGKRNFGRLRTGLQYDYYANVTHLVAEEEDEIVELVPQRYTGQGFNKWWILIICVAVACIACLILIGATCCYIKHKREARNKLYPSY